MISIIVAVARNFAIGKDNKLLWHIPEDLKRFKKITNGHRLIMGRNTWLSLPVRPLPNRTSIVITDQEDEVFNDCIMAHSIEDAMSMCDSQEECFVIGGASVYRQFLELADKIYYTKVNDSFDADTYFPELDSSKWLLISEEPGTLHPEGLDYSFQVYIRK